MILLIITLTVNNNAECDVKDLSVVRSVPV